MNRREFGKRQCARADGQALFANARLIKRIYNASTYQPGMRKRFAINAKARLEGHIFVLLLDLNVLRRTDQPKRSRAEFRPG